MFVLIHIHSVVTVLINASPINQSTGGHAPHHVSDIGHHRIGSCRAVATSGIPPREPLFNASICTAKEVFSLGDGDAFVEVVPPVMLPTYRCD